jgi:hypothetical protein
MRWVLFRNEQVYGGRVALVVLALRVAEAQNMAVVNVVNYF